MFIGKHRLKLEIYFNYVIVTLYDKRLIHYMDEILKDLTSYRFEFNKRFRRMTRVPDKVYAITHESEGVYRIPRMILKTFLGNIGYKANVKNTDIELINNIKETVTDKIKVTFSKKFIPRDYQQEYSDILVKESTDTKLVDLVTGGGKSLIFSHAFTRIKKKVFILILPMYIEKWAEDILKYTDISKERIYTIQGSKQLMDIMYNPKESKKKYDVYIASMRTMANYINEYSENSLSYVSEYPIHPDNLLQELGVGVLLNDETHQHYYALYKCMMYLRPDKFIGLTATLNSNDSRMRYLYGMLFPSHYRISNILEYKPYIDLILVRYFFDNPRKIQHKRNQGYSQVLFEQSIMVNSLTRNDYYEMIKHYIDKYYINRRKEGEKCLIFAATVDMCKYLAGRASKDYSKLNIATYIQEDEYEVIHTSDIIFSTIISSGTAIDYPKLITTIQTISLGSLQANLQSMGRLRKIEGRETLYVCLYAGNIDKHRDLLSTRMGVIGNKVKSTNKETYETKHRFGQLRTR